MSHYLGEGGRLGDGPSDSLVSAGFAAESAHGPRLARALSLADLAHAVALVEGGDLDRDRGGRLLAGLLELHAIPPEDFPWDPRAGDAFNSREAELTRRIGPAAAGWLSAGRPRREAFRVALRLVGRSGARAVHDAALGSATALRVQAERHAGDLAADYTYLQPAQPTTIGHWLLGYAYPALRDAERLKACATTLDRSVAGVGGSAGSRWRLDRQRLAELLGCTGLVAHARDAMWQADGYVDLLAALATLATHQAQLAQDLEILASREFGALELAEGHSRASALMPQKRNPYALPVIREAAGAAVGALAATLVTLHTGSARTDHFHALNGLVPERLEAALRSAALCADVIAGLRLDPAAMAAAAREGFTAAADVADLVAQEGGLDYRTAHTVVGRAVRQLIDEQLSPTDLTVGRLAAATREVIDAPLRLDEASLAAALDPAACVLERLQRGSCAPAEMAALLADVAERVAAGERWSAETAARIVDSEGRLLAAAERIAAG